MERFACPERVEDSSQSIAAEQFLIPGGTLDQAIGQAAMAVGHEQVARFDGPENAASSVLVEPFPRPDLNRLRVRDAFRRGHLPHLLVVDAAVFEDEQRHVSGMLDTWSRNAGRAAMAAYQRSKFGYAGRSGTSSR